MKLPTIQTDLTENAKKIGLFLVILGCFSYNMIVFNTILIENKELTKEVDVFSNALSISQKNLYTKNIENKNLNSNLIAEKETNVAFQGQIEGIKSTVGILEKLSKTDSELLKKYSKVYFLNENYIPQKLTEINPDYLFEKTKIVQTHGDVWPKLEKMLNDAKDAGIEIKILSAYRSFNTQASLKSTYKVTYGAGANKFSADQGYSEHQLGTTFDFTTPKLGSALNGFEKTDAYKWLTQNAYKYGFVMSYPKENTYYIFEPWHWRYIGLSLSNRLHEENTYFYSLDQRIINEYLVGIFD